MIREFHLEDLEEISIHRQQSNGGATTRIVIRDDFTASLAIVIPDGEILDALAQQLMLASLIAKDFDIGEQLLDVDF